MAEQGSAAVAATAPATASVAADVAAAGCGRQKEREGECNLQYVQGAAHTPYSVHDPRH